MPNTAARETRKRGEGIMPAKEAFPPTDGRSARAEEIDRARGALSTAHFGGAASESPCPRAGGVPWGVRVGSHGA